MHWAKGLTILAVVAALGLAPFAIAGDLKDIKDEIKAAKKEYIAIDKKADSAEVNADNLSREMLDAPLAQKRAVKVKWYRANIEAKKLAVERKNVGARYKSELDKAFALNSLVAIKYLWTAVLNKKKLIFPEIAAADDGITALTDGPAIKFLSDKLGGGAQTSIKIILCKAFAKMSHASVDVALIDALGDRTWQVVSAAADALKNKKIESSVEPLIEAMKKAEKKDNKRLITDLRVALRKVTGQSSFIYATDFEGWWKHYGKKEGLGDGPISGKVEHGGIKTMLYGEITSKKVIFIVDRSGSMLAIGTVPGTTTGEDDPVTRDPTKPRPKEKPGVDPRMGGVQPGFRGSRLDICKKEFKWILSELPEDTEFNVIFFANKIEKCWKKLTKATEKNKAEAWKFIEPLKAVGGTNVHGSLMAAFNDKKVDTIYLLTDGAPTAGKTSDPTQICAEVRERNQKRNVKIHCVAMLVGVFRSGGVAQPSGQLEAFLRKLATENGGTFKLIK